MITLWRRNMNKTYVTIGAFVLAVLLILVLSFLISYPLMLLWNIALVPAVNVLNPVGWIQMWGIVILFGCLFKTYTVTAK